MLFLKRLDEIHMLKESKAATLKRPLERRIYPEDQFKPERSARESIPFEGMRWSRLKHSET